MNHHAIAIDGPAASGKSTMARALAERLGLVMVNSGAMYRAVTWKVLEEKINPTDAAAVRELVGRIRIDCGHDGTFSTISIDGVDPTPFLRSAEVNANVSAISAIPEVREKLVALQRDYLKSTHVVMEGRDIGSVVFPETPFKIYIDADPSVRNHRRSDDGEVDSVETRDAADSSRTTAPLVIADGATVLDTSKLSIEGAIKAAIDILRAQGFPMKQSETLKITGEEPDHAPMMRWIYWLGWMSFGAAYRTLFGLRIIGRENIIHNGPVLIASNHQSFLDPPLIGNLYKTEMVFFARKTLFKGIGKWLYPKWNAIPVDQDRPDMSSMKTVIRKLKEGWRVLVFPEGARTLDGEIGQAASGIGLIAAKAGVPIQPVRIFGADEALPRGSGKIRFARITVKVGRPIVLTPEELKSYSGKTGYEALTNRIMDAIKDL
ncbi:(d)CMP kinase [Luteolibacter algae]|uniref:Cytidylate kinase n=1 Tax=Luteolibacter algae TaxID=454151 RepID=A0ABW5D3M1_9BACT